jgi:hypothetical protein
VPQLLRDEVGDRLLGGRDVPLKLTHDLAEELLRVLSGFDLAMLANAEMRPRPNV